MAKSDPPYLTVRMRRYGSLININHSGRTQNLFEASYLMKFKIFIWIEKEAKI